MSYERMAMEAVGCLRLWVKIIWKTKTEPRRLWESQKVQRPTLILYVMEALLLQDAYKGRGRPDALAVPSSMDLQASGIASK